MSKTFTIILTLLLSFSIINNSFATSNLAPSSELLNKQGENEKPFKNLIFEGGGVKGAAYGGALQELKGMGILDKINRVGGTSAGAITAVLLSVGYSPKELSDIMDNTNFNDFLDSDWLILQNLIRVLRVFGWYKGNSFKNWITDLIEKKTGNGNLTFKQHQEMVGKNGFRELYLIGTNLSKQRFDVFSHETTPDIIISDAVRISMGIPLFFASKKIDNDVFVDGGLTMNYPVNIFDNKKYINNPDHGERISYNPDPEFRYNYETLGFRLDSADEIEYNNRGWSNVPKNIKHIIHYIKALISMVDEAASKKHLHKNDWHRTIFIDTKGIKTTDFDLSMEDIEMLKESGRKGVQKYFADKWKKQLFNLSQCA